MFKMSGKEAGKIELPAMFETKVSEELLHEVITAYNANQRSGTHSTKTRGEVSGGGAKPWKQKGTGNARSGSNRSPLWRKGGIIFGPKPRDYSINVSQQKRRTALDMALSAKVRDGNLLAVEEIEIKEPKTKTVHEILKGLKLLETSVLLVIDKKNEALRLASRNIPNLIVKNAANINAYEVLWARKVILTKPALDQLVARSKE